ncbi:hypothetical protein BGZ60DRAFT_522358 [Tricladium varicosporioides]|nr:hypothetical protein BGZ60DRAFT_522358 [Hymenoscyphus varicosporioides]
MTSQLSDGVALEQKIQPVPSSDEMALDLDINGTSSTNRDENNFESTSPDITLNKTGTPSLSNNDPNKSNAFGVNGSANSDAYSSNQAISSSPIDATIESQATENTSPSAPNSSHLHDTNTTTTEVQKLSISPEAQEDSTLLASANSAIDIAIDDVSGSSAVPPVIDVRESDLRNSTATANNESRETDRDLSVDGAQDLFGDNDITVDAVVTEEPADICFEPANLPQTSSGNPSPPHTQAQSNDMTASKQNGITPPESPPRAAIDGEDVHMDNTPLPTPSSKVAREREDDDESQPSAKRTKTEEMTDEGAGISMVAPRNGQTAKNQDQPAITQHEQKEIIKILKNVARTSYGRNFKAPVKELWPNFAALYAEKIAHEVDLATMETNLKNNLYANMGQFKAEVELIYANAVTFNGETHGIAASAKQTTDSILDKVANISPPPVPAPKKEKKQAKRPTPAAEAPLGPPARRQSRGAATSVAPAAVVAEASVPKPQPATTFPLNPQTGTPLIRRDSTQTDGGRPKREIHPPKNKDLPYTTRPKSKKSASELKFCEQVVGELKKDKYWAFANPFLQPVDPVALNIPNYLTVIKFPMDVSTVESKLKEGVYGNAKEFEKDMKLIFANCYKFNPAGNPIRDLGKQFESVFNTEFAKKDQWLHDRMPAAVSPSSPAESEEDESEEEEEEEAPMATGMTSAALRLIEEQKKLIQLMSNKKTDPSIIQMQQQMIAIVQQTVDKENAERVQTKKPKSKTKVKKEKEKKVSQPKKTPGGKKAGGNRQNNRYLGTLEKEVISAGLTSLPDNVASDVLDMIKADQPSVDIGDDGTLELDIDQVSTPTLWRIHGLIMHHAPEVDAQVRKQFAERETPRALAKPPAKKKNKPMSKTEQERKISQLTANLDNFARQASGSQEPVMQTVERPEQQEESSGDDTSDSEED